MTRDRIFSLFMGLAITACGSFKVRDVNKVEVDKIHKVAVASFSFFQPEKKSIGLNLNSGKVGATQNHSMIAGQDDEVTKAYVDLGKALHEKLGWNVVGYDSLKGNSTYQQAYDSKMKGWQQKAPVEGKQFTVPQIMDAQSLRRMKVEDRDQLMGALGVDALMEAQVQIIFNNKDTVMGYGPKHPQAYFSFWVYSKGQPRPVWFDGRVIGDAVKETIAVTAFWDEKELTRLGRVSASSAYRKMSTIVQ